MKDIADHLGVSRQLVSLVLRGAEGPSAESRERILTAARDLGYRPNASARLLRQGATRTIGVAFSLHNSFQADVVERMFARAAEHGYTVVTEPRGPGRDTETVTRELIEQRVEALAVFNPEPGTEVLDSARSAVPVVLLGQWSEDTTLDTVHVDERAGLRRVVDHLLALGHRQITYLGGAAGGTVGADRAEAYGEAMAAVGLEARADVVDAGFDEEAGASAARSVLGRDEWPTAIVCGSDHAAAGALAVLARAGVRVPEEMSVVGFDDNRLAELSYHQLTTVHQDVEETVDATLSIMLDRLHGGHPPEEATPGRAAREGRRQVTSARLVVRQSTASPRPRPTA
ncbi:LacI family DNA-binding transcriptional regulator [Brachybacterium kimchii]|uniref:LacI family transcriptional regulator n=1 Tax=Brachybacterium kimchii TaxID=2942909 RepID=A0ABY4N2H7_9MICO|nr:LacI family DNA-binding transcriptional regulator [Brachybacterium kimchii]UQN28773.1 LacI family transcriptional regulator [Brachybacterium kimchii]